MIEPAHLSASVRFDEDHMRIQTYKDAERMQTIAAGEITARLAEQIAKEAVDMLAREVGLHPTELRYLLKTIAEDPTFKEKMYAQIAADRIGGVTPRDWDYPAP